MQEKNMILMKKGENLFLTRIILMGIDAMHLIYPYFQKLLFAKSTYFRPHSQTKTLL